MKNSPSIHFLSCALCATLLAAIAIQPANAGGGPGPGIIKHSSNRGAINRLLALNTAIMSSHYFWERAAKRGWPEWGAAPDSDLAHKISAYLWGQQVGDPGVVRAVRTSSEVAQYYGYSAKSGLKFLTFGVVNSPYQPWTLTGPGGLLDSKSDIDLSVQGSEDAQAGVMNVPR